MKKKLKHILPWNLQQRLRMLRRSIRFRRHGLPRKFVEQVEEIKNQPLQPVLFAGHVKSGNTWLRFLIYNYFNVLHTDATSTLTYRKLNQIQSDSLGDPVPIKGPAEGFPYLVRTHLHHCKAFDHFTKGIYVYRNPLDTLVSAFHFKMQRANPDFPHAENLDAFVLHNLIPWEIHVRDYLKQKRFYHISYEQLKADPMAHLKKIIEYLGYEFDQEVGKKSAALSSFENIKQMGRDMDQMYGNGGKDFKGEFTRKGMVGNFSEELKPGTIQKARATMKKFGYGDLTVPF